MHSQNHALAPHLHFFRTNAQHKHTIHAPATLLDGFSQNKQLPVPEDTWGSCVATGGVAVVPGDDGGDGEGDEEWASMEEKITTKYMPGKLAALTQEVAVNPEASKRREAAAAAVAQYKGGQDSNSQVYSCAGCDGQGKV